MITSNSLSSRTEKGIAVLFVMAVLVASSIFTFRLGTNFNSSTVAEVIAVVFVGIAVTSPQISIILTFCYLAVLGDIRRWFQVQYGPVDFDLLLLVGPLAAIMLVIKPFFWGRLDFSTKLSKWVLLLMAIMGLQVLNILYVPIQVNLIGIMFYGIPLTWFWIGKEYGTKAFTERLLFVVVFAVAIAACGFGLTQSFIGFPDYQMEWIRQNAMRGIVLNNVTSAGSRPFSFFTSNQEYGTYLAIMIILGLTGFLYKNNRWLLLFLPAAGIALILTSIRGSVVAVVFSSAITWVVLARGSVTSIGRIIIFALVIGSGLYFALSWAGNADLGENINPLVQHQTQGLLNPLDNQKSTASDHTFMMVGGIIQSFTSPAGKGLGSTTLAGTKFGIDTSGTESDIGNLFISLSPIGGIVYCILIFLVLKQAGIFVRRTRTAVATAMFAILVGTCGQWMNGAMYSIAPIVWFSIGALDKQYNEYEQSLLMTPGRML